MWVQKHNKYITKVYFTAFKSMPYNDATQRRNGMVVNKRATSAAYFLIGRSYTSLYKDNCNVTIWLT